MVKAETFCSLGLELLCDLRRSFVYTNWESTKDARIITDMRCPLRRQASKAAVSVAVREVEGIWSYKNTAQKLLGPHSSRFPW